VACLNTGRRFIGIEKDASCFAIAQERLAVASSQLRMAV
jgi:DNA modification methylase